MNKNETAIIEKKRTPNDLSIEEEKIRKEIIHNLKDVVSCLNFCDYEIHKLEKQVSARIQQLDSN